MIELLDDGLCDGCGICLDNCPCDVFRADPDTGRCWIAHHDDCQTCFICELDCPRDAIRVGALRKVRTQAWTPAAAAGRDAQGSSAHSSAEIPAPVQEIDVP